jgi:hypothetical protein
LYEFPSQTEQYDIHNEQYEQMKHPQFTAKKIADGLEFGHGTISGKTEQEIQNTVEAVIFSDKILVEVDTDDTGQIIDDDGCGDGRGVSRVFTREEVYKRSLNRPKVFGGAATMTMAIRVGLGLGEGKNLNLVLNEATDELNVKGVDFGAHTDEHARGNNCGCGAIDRAPEIIEAAKKYKEQIAGVIDLLGLSNVGLPEVDENIASWVRNLADYNEYSGSAAMDGILHSANKPVIKQLNGEHKEIAIVLNHIAGRTINQQAVRSATDDEAQVFGVDVWRMNEIAMQLFPGDSETQHKAILSMVTYTLATAAVLTKGNLPVYVIEAEEENALAHV